MIPEAEGLQPVRTLRSGLLPLKEDGRLQSCRFGGLEAWRLACLDAWRLGEAGRWQAVT